MSLVAKLAPVLDGVADKDRPWVYRVYDTWEDWLAAAQPFLLQRRWAWVHHDDLGNEVISLEDRADWWKACYWKGDMAGVLAFEGDVVVKALLYRELDEETIELVFLQGSLAHNTQFKRMWWNLGYRKATYLARQPQHDEYIESHLNEPHELEYELEPEHPTQRRITIKWKKCAREKCHDRRDPKGPDVGPADVGPGVSEP